MALTTVTALRDGSRVVYVCEPGEILALTPNGSRAVVAHPERPPKFVNADGTEEPLVFSDITAAGQGVKV